MERNLAPSPRMAYAIRMSIAELRQLPRKEKLQILETLWTDIATDDALVESPSWHAEELQKTEEDLKAGKIEVVDWESAKRDLRKQFPHKKLTAAPAEPPRSEVPPQSMDRCGNSDRRE